MTSKPASRSIPSPVEFLAGLAPGFEEVTGGGGTNHPLAFTVTALSAALPPARARGRCRRLGPAWRSGTARRAERNAPAARGRDRDCHGGNDFALFDGWGRG